MMVSYAREPQINADMPFQYLFWMLDRFATGILTDFAPATERLLKTA